MQHKRVLQNRPSRAEAVRYVPLQDQFRATTAMELAGRSKLAFPSSLLPENAVGWTALGASKVLCASIAVAVRILPLPTPSRLVTTWAFLRGSVLTSAR